MIILTFNSGVPYLAEEGTRGKTGCPEDTEILEKDINVQADYSTSGTHRKCWRTVGRTNHRRREII